MRLLIVEDDPHIAELLRDGLTEDGYECDQAGDATEAAALAQLFPYSLLILDVMLPEGIDAGYQLGRRLRAEGLRTPILYLTARGTVEDRVEGLEAGGDDYLVKPFAFQELRARVRALLRRASGNAQNTVALPFGWVIDLGGRELYGAGVRADLTRREFGLLELLVLHAGRAFTRDEIIDRLWGGDGGVEPKVIDVYVSTIRRKTDERLIETLRGTGYRLGRAG
ncbi:response regulator transcription factor [Deinococcus aquatilis]|jgi:two-component system response regulator QseB|uniref:response regulator transcription factor n=1 Tax=Deinococcus aquatilis TaxID=519440 RepID=UPI00035CAA62|nr:response regulator transcription factor [Deinococcus aquatilis]